MPRLLSRAFWPALLLALVGALAPAPAAASLPSFSDIRADELRGLPSLPPQALPERASAPGPFNVRPKTRVRVFDLELHCSIGGQTGLTCTSRPAYAVRYGGRASERSVFTGYFFDSETKLYFAKSRFYDPEVGRFTSQDSFLGDFDQPPSLHRYAYGWNRPTFFIDPTGHAVKLTGEYTTDENLNFTIPKATDETTVYANPTPAQLEQQAREGEISAGDAAVRGAGAILAPLHSKPDYEKSYARNFAEETVGGIAETLASPGLKTYEGLAQQDAGKIAQGVAETAAVGAVGLVVKEAAPGIINKAVEKAPWLVKDVRELGAKALERAKGVLEGATQELTERLPFRYTTNPGANLGNLRLKGATKAPRSGPGVSSRPTKEFLRDVAQRAERTIGGTGSVPGTEKHGYAEQLIQRYQRRFGKVGGGLETEQSYLGGEHLGRHINLRGSVRLDVVEGSVESPTAVYDFKFTINPNPKIPQSRIDKIRLEAGLGRNVPVDPVHP